MPFTDSPETNALKSKIEEILKAVPEFVTQSGELKLNIIKNAAENGEGNQIGRASCRERV